ncbi:MAG: serine/threonine protein kinase, partial [Candidatus Eisenbacteria bacterium]|nr:serine/threonine protein kinase [Candidatus Eisenbacteria bacterium]
MIGKTVSHYRVLEKLGEGGMGVVYKAQDTKLERLVALKFLAPELTRDPSARDRFIHEAKAASALDHPNICTVHEIDEADGQTFIAMACVDGQTLRHRLGSGPLKLDEAVDIAAQVAQGLQEAHEKGVVHRDVKSSNIMLTPKGQVKIMDFGLAKLAGGPRVTKTGTSVGTAAYMSPEQAQGEAVDQRTDIWSLGVIIYEMVTGRLPFAGDYEQSVVYSILNEAPEPITAVRSGVPMELERIVGKALEKEPKRRYQRAEDLLVDLRNFQDRSPGGRLVAAVSSGSPARGPTSGGAG